MLFSSTYLQTKVKSHHDLFVISNNDHDNKWKNDGGKLNCYTCSREQCATGCLQSKMSNNVVLRGKVKHQTMIKTNLETGRGQTILFGRDWKRANKDQIE